MADSEISPILAPNGESINSPNSRSALSDLADRSMSVEASTESFDQVSVSLMF